MTDGKGPLEDYFTALDRLKSGKSTIVNKGTRITNDAVSVEAGRAKGSIKKSRAIFADLILAIDEAAGEQSKPAKEKQEALSKKKDEIRQLRLALDASLAREVSLLHELFEAKKKLNKLTAEKVIPIRRTRRKSTGEDS
ncbi:hypothetical protein AYM40_35360 [Paraburkholderia phytofirmans OLGA172]|uniref:Uncharacterized protein n=1 Tax=Paraburkholderia phytofirmans OLGA172 TaxID=1417228 RepID=A0A160FW96_9BURK|nr:hypothetical protein [Paraburkholderia phytofirmans]ANB77356.1 hypothetical protein AYM40_35360 [Paraburkholderia phytofirmans OLGA172]